MALTSSSRSKSGESESSRDQCLAASALTYVDPFAKREKGHKKQNEQTHVLPGIDSERSVAALQSSGRSVCIRVLPDDYTELNAHQYSANMVAELGPNSRSLSDAATAEKTGFVFLLFE